MYKQAFGVCVCVSAGGCVGAYVHVCVSVFNWCVKVHVYKLVMCLSTNGERA